MGPKPNSPVSLKTEDIRTQTHTEDDEVKM